MKWNCSVPVSCIVLYLFAIPSISAAASDAATDVKGDPEVGPVAGVDQKADEETATQRVKRSSTATNLTPKQREGKCYIRCTLFFLKGNDLAWLLPHISSFTGGGLLGKKVFIYHKKKMEYVFADWKNRALLKGWQWKSRCSLCSLTASRHRQASCGRPRVIRWWGIWWSPSSGSWTGSNSLCPTSAMWHPDILLHSLRRTRGGRCTGSSQPWPAFPWPMAVVHHQRSQWTFCQCTPSSLIHHRRSIWTFSLHRWKPLGLQSRSPCSCSIGGFFKATCLPPKATRALGIFHCSWNCWVMAFQPSFILSSGITSSFHPPGPGIPPGKSPIL